MSKLSVHLLLAGCIGVMASLAWSSPAEVTPCHQIKVTGNPFYPPAIWVHPEDSTRLEGAAIALLEIALEPVGVTVTTVNADTWARAQSLVRSGAVDMLAGAFMTDERKSWMAYVEPPFMVIESVIWVRKDRPFRFRSWDDLIGKQGVTLNNNSFGEAFDQFARTRLKVMGVNSAEQIFQLVRVERADYGIYELQQARALSRAADLLAPLTHLTPPISSEGLFFTLSKRSSCLTPELLTFLSTRVEALVASGVAKSLEGAYQTRWDQQKKGSSEE